MNAEVILLMTNLRWTVWRDGVHAILVHLYGIVNAQGVSIGIEALSQSHSVVIGSKKKSHGVVDDQVLDLGVDGMNERRLKSGSPLCGSVLKATTIVN
jgi:hypothetical protein